MMPGGHWLHLEHPATFNYFVKKWLQKLPEKPAYATCSAHADETGTDSKLHDEL